MNTRCSLPDTAIMLLLLLLPLEGSAQAVDSSSQVCPSGLEGLFPDPTSCNYYYECRFDSNGVQTTVRQQCPPDLPYFKPTVVAYGYCARTFRAGPGSANCRSQNMPGSGPVSPITILPPYTGTNNPGQGSFSCPRFLICNRTSLNGLYGDPTSCSRYYLCIDYTAYLVSCPDGMQFSQTTLYCDYPNRAGCNLQARQNQGYLCNDGASYFQFNSVRLLMTCLFGSAVVSLLRLSAPGQ